MFSYIIGTIEYKGDNLLILDNNNIGYEITISNNTLMSFTSGRLSISTVSSVMIAADRIASAAFFAPPISTSPTSGCPPLMIYCSITHLKNMIYSFSHYRIFYTHTP